MGVFESSGRKANPLATVGVIAALIGAVFSGVLWLHHFQPDSSLLGSYSAQLVTGGPLANQLRFLAAVFGIMGVIAAIASGLGGSGGGGTVVAALLLGVVALSYPVLTALNLVTRFVPNPMR